MQNNSEEGKFSTLGKGHMVLAPHLSFSSAVLYMSPEQWHHFPVTRESPRNDKAAGSDDWLLIPLAAYIQTFCCVGKITDSYLGFKWIFCFCLTLNSILINSIINYFHAAKFNGSFSLYLIYLLSVAFYSIEHLLHETDISIYIFDASFVVSLSF